MSLGLSPLFDVEKPFLSNRFFQFHLRCFRTTVHGNLSDFSRPYITLPRVLKSEVFFIILQCLWCIESPIAMPGGIGQPPPADQCHVCVGLRDSSPKGYSTKGPLKGPTPLKASEKSSPAPASPVSAKSRDSSPRRSFSPFKAFQKAVGSPQLAPPQRGRLNHIYLTGVSKQLHREKRCILVGQCTFT